MNTYQLSISIRADDDADSIDTEIRRALHGINENEPGWDVVAVRDRKIIYHRRPDVDEMDRRRVYGMMLSQQRHRFLVLTKRPLVAQSFYRRFPSFGRLPNVWLGVTVEDQQRVRRLDTLRRTDVAHRWASFEPLLEPVVLERKQLDSLEWAVVGGETGAKARLTKPGWLISLTDQLWAHGLPVWFKEWGHALERVADPSDLEVRDLYCGIGDTRELPPELDVLA